MTSDVACDIDRMMATWDWPGNADVAELVDALDLGSTPSSLHQRDHSANHTRF
jgi:hypothetical protein